ncbi:SDR family NAD(P)-dependent oxidoreductase [Streptomyces abikoensis]|uniref:SDR family NAD(P)-dependent oxidoreductase n=1 Tax=Streptomyces abikoensis TaxID=97398 RepID=UPI003676BCF6
MKCPVAIVGMACRYPDADGPDELWRTVLAGRRAFRRIPPERLRIADYAPGASVAGDDIVAERAAVLEGWTFDRQVFRVPGGAFRAADLTHWLALDVAAAALRDAGLSEGEGLDPDRVGVVIGNSLTGEFSRTGLLRLRWPYVRRTVDTVLGRRGLAEGERRELLGELEELYKSPFPVPGDESLAGGLANTISGRICNHFGFHGAGYTVDAACASSLVSVVTACTALAAGDLDLALAGGVDLSLDPFELVGFSRLGALARGPMRVYDRNPTGFLPGEGCGVLVLARAEDAQRLGLRAYAVVEGWGLSSDGHGGLTRPERTGQALALRRAYERAGFAPATAGLIEGHGTGTAVGDEVELAVLGAALGSEGGPPVALGSVKANIGHTKAAAGAAGLIKAALAVHHGVLPPTTGCDDPHPLLTGPLRTLGEPEDWPGRAVPRRASVNSVGFGGVNAHVVLESADARRHPYAYPRPYVPAPGWDVFPVGGDDPGEVAGRLVRLAGTAESLSEAELTDLCVELAASADGKGAAVRVAVTASSPGELAERLRAAAGSLGGRPGFHGDAAAGVFTGVGPMARLGLLFPGQGAAGGRVGPLGRMVGVGDLLAEVPEGRGGDVDTAVVQPAVVAASLAGLRYLDRLGVRARAALGHSLGELTALTWAGALPPAAAVRLARARGDLMARYAEGGGGMLAVAAPVATAESLLAGTDAVIAAVNGPDRLTVAGPVPSLALVRAEARRRGVAVVALTVSHAFHSAAMRPALPELEKCFIEAGFGRLSGTVVSSVTAAVLGPDTDVAALLTEQVTAPVRFGEAVGELARHVDVLMEVGAGTTVSAPARDNTTAPVLTLDVTGGVGALAATTAALYAACGADVRAWTAGRFHRPLDLSRPRVFLSNPCEVDFPDPAPSPSPPGASPRPPEAPPRPGRGGARGGASARGDADGSPLPLAGAAPGAASAPGLPPSGSGVLPPEPTTPAESAGGAAGTEVVGGPGAESPAARGGGPLTTIRTLIATALELPADAIRDDDLLLSDLHVNSLRLAQIAADAARALGREAPVDTGALVTASVAGLAAHIAALPASRGEGEGDVPVEGVAPWVRAFTHRLVPRPATANGRATRAHTWTRLVPDDHPLADAIHAAFPTTDDADAAPATLVALPPGPTPEECVAALHAAAANAEAPLLLLHHRAVGDVVARSVAAERPGLSCLVVDAPPHPDGIRQAADEAVARGIAGYAEIVLDDTGRPHAPVTEHRPLPEPDVAAIPLGPGDVCLVTGGAKGIGAESALALARATGARLVLLGRSAPGDDAEVDTWLRRFDDEKVTALYVTADVTDPAAVRRRVAEAEARLGPVTAVLHCAGRNEPGRLETVTTDRLRAACAPKRDGLDAVLAAVDTRRLRLLVAFGSVIARIGLPGEADYALANDLMRRRVDELAQALRHCRCLTVEWSQWEGAGMAQRLGAVETLRRQGVAPIPVADGTRILLSLLGAPDLPSTVLVAGRLPRAETLRHADESLPLLRFLERPLVHQPGVEVVADSRVGLGGDPYLADHALDGVPLLPAVVGLEAMAQAAAAVTGHDGVLTVTEAAFERPVTVPPDGSRTVRVAALRHDDGTVVAVVRSDETGFSADHFRAVYRTGGESARAPVAAPAPAPAARSPHYGELFFHGPRFRRVVRYRRLSGRHCVAEVAAGGAGEWFSGFHSPRLLLGDAALRDAYVHVLQGCVPHRRVLPVGVDAVRFHGPAPGEGTVIVHAHETARDADGYRYDLRVESEAGTTLETWHGLRLKDVGPLPRPADAPWPAELLGPYLTRVLDGLLPEARADLAAGPTADGLLPGTDGFRRAAHLGDRVLAAVAGRPVAVDWAPVPDAPPERWRSLLGPRAAAVAEEADRATGGEPGHGYARLLTCRQVMLALGARPDAPLRVERTAADGWVLLGAGDLAVATVVVRVAGLPSPVAVAVGSGPPVRVPRSVRVGVAGGRA